MKKIFTLSILAALFTTQSFGQYTQNFDAANSLTSGCSIVSNASLTDTVSQVINGTRSLYSAPPVNSSGTRDYGTPYLNITSSIIVSFNYKLTKKLAGSSSTRTIEVGLQDKAGVFTSLTTISMDSKNDPIVTTAFVDTFSVASGIKRLVIKMGGGTGAGTVRIVLDDLITDASPYYSLGGTCNSAPIAVNDNFASLTASAYSGNVTGNDSDPNGETILASIVSQPLATEGTVAMDGTGNFTFTPAVGFTGGPVTFTYQVRDNGYDEMSSTATVTINYPTLTILPIKLLSFQGSLVNNAVQLNWLVDDNHTGDRFEIEKSYNGKNYSSVSVVFNTSKTGTEAYVYNETTKLEGGVYYRIKIINKDNSTSYSKVVFLKNASDFKTEGIKLTQNPIQSQLAFSFNAEKNSVGKVNLYNMAGVKVYSFTINIQKGTNTIVEPVENNLAKGTYILEVASATKRTPVKVIK